MADITRTEQYRLWQMEMQRYRNDNFKNLAHESKATQEQRKNRAKKDYAYFVRTYFPDTAKCKCGAFQIEAADYLKNTPNARAVFEWARGHAKSTHMGVLIPLWLKIQDKKQFNTMIVVSKSEDSAVRLLADLQQQLAYNELYIRDFGQQMKTGNWSEGEFMTNDGCYFVALGRGQSPRGIKNNSHRPDYIVIDDIDDDQMSRNPRRVDETVKWCLSALLGTMAMGRGRFVLVGNRIGQDSVLTKMSERPHFFHTVVNALDENGAPSWKENYTREEIAALREQMGELLFQKEYMNNPVIEGAIFEKRYIRYGKILPLWKYRALVCYTDPSFKSSTKNDYKATVLVGLTPKGEYHVIKVYAAQTKISEMVAWHYEIRDYVGQGACKYYMEANFIQDTLLDEFRKAGEKLGIHIPILGDRRKKPEKFARIEAMQPLFERGLVLFNEDEKSSSGFEVLVNQLLGFQRGSILNDDAPDALESAIWMLSNRLRKQTSNYRSLPHATRRY